jgi:tetraacyldisaccharide 4'-kinase
MPVSHWRDLLTTERPSFLQAGVRLLLRLGTVPYYLAICFRNWAFDKGWRKVYRSSLPVVSVGNLSVGGTGKSPAVAFLADWFRQRGIRVAILSRGYGQLDDGRNDEALELELKLPDVPHLQHPDRVASAQVAEQELQMELLILDDGFQHRRLARDLDLVLIDATDSIGARRLLPAGLRREPMSGLTRASAIIWTRVDQVNQSELEKIIRQAERYSPGTKSILTVHRPKSILLYPNQTMPLEELCQAPVLAFCGIGNPHSFFQSLEDLGAEILDRRQWPDHHAYTKEDIGWLSCWRAEHSSAKLVCTVKDWVKIQESNLGGRELWALSIDLEIVRGQSDLECMLQVLADDILSARHTAGTLGTQQALDVPEQMT